MEGKELGELNCSYRSGIGFRESIDDDVTIQTSCDKRMPKDWFARNKELGVTDGR
jgi:hypothetical protein